MKKITRLRICNRGLLALTVVMLASGIQLEVTAGSLTGWVWIHILLGIILTALICWHLQLHFKLSDCVRKLANRKSRITRWLALTFALTIVTAIVTCFHWIGHYGHSPIGAVHGKIGFLFIAFAAWHTVKHIAFFKKPLKHVKK